MNHNQESTDYNMPLYSLHAQLSYTDATNTETIHINLYTHYSNRLYLHLIIYIPSRYPDDK